LKEKVKIVNKEFDVQILFTVLRRHWWAPIALIFLFWSFAFFYLRYTKPTFESTMLLQLNSKDNAKDIMAIEGIDKGDADLSAEVELLKSQLLFNQAIKLLNYPISIFSKGSVLSEDKYKAGDFSVQPFLLNDSSLVDIPVVLTVDNNNTIYLDYEYGGSKFGVKGKLNQHFVNQHFDIIIRANNITDLKKASEVNQLYFQFNSIVSLSARLLPGLQVIPVNEAAKTVQILYTGMHPQLCHDLTLAVATAFLSFDESNKRKGDENVLKFIDEQLESLSLKLEQSKDSMMMLQSNIDFMAPEAFETSIYGEVSKLEEELIKKEEDKRIIKNVALKLKSDPNRLEIYKQLPEMLGKSYEVLVTDKIGELLKLVEQKENLLYNVTEEHSGVKLINQKIALKSYSIIKSLNLIYDRLNEESTILNLKISSEEAKINGLPEKKIEFGRLGRIQALNEQYFNLLTENKYKYSISDAGYTTNYQMLSLPTMNELPMSPNKSLIYISFMSIGLIIGIASLFYKFLTFNEINLLDDLNRLLPEHVTTLGGVPLVKNDMQYSQLLAFDFPKSQLAESFRNIRTNLNYIKSSYQTIAITSSISGEGKTFVALNLAGILAMSGKKTILIDLDLRKPKIHLGFNVSNDKGMSGLIINQYSIEECVQKSQIENLDFITAGPIPPNPSELIISESFKEKLAELKKIYDIIIIDNPPVGLVSDGIKNLTDADIPIYVFKSHYSKRTFIGKINDLFEMQQLKSLNVILNGVKSSRRGGSYGYGYGYGYTYGYGSYGGYGDEGYFQNKPSKNPIIRLLNRIGIIKFLRRWF
jgi:capsular exopolysaccharide synthesis family protein